jgi:predicted deacylase
MRHLQILPGKPPEASVKWHLYGDGDDDKGLPATQRGFFVPEVTVLQNVKKGETLGHLRNLHGETIEVFHAPSGGIVVFVRQLPVVDKGEQLFFLTGLAQ